MLYIDCEARQSPVPNANRHVPRESDTLSAQKGEHDIWRFHNPFYTSNVHFYFDCYKDMVFM